MTRRISVKEIISLASQALQQHGLSDEDTAIVTAHLLDGEISGHTSHGFFRIPGIVRALQKNGPGSIIESEHETPLSALLNGGRRLGLVVAQLATELAIQRAQKSMIGIVGAFNYIGTTGAMGYYSRIIADNDLIGIVLCNSEYAMAPWGGKKAILGTNPFSIGIPAVQEPIIADLATSAWSYGSLALAMKEGRQIPEGVVLDKDGNPSTDPNDADNGCQLPMAGHKGYALGLMIEILAGPLIKAKAGREAVLGSDGFLVIALSPELFTTIQDFKSQVGRLIEEIKGSPHAPGVTEIFIPGQRSHAVRLMNKNNEFIEFPNSIIADIEALIS